MSSWRCALINITGVLIKGENVEPDMYTGRMPREDEGRDLQSEECQGLPANRIRS